MSQEYKQCINDYDVDGLARMLLMSSSQQITNWISMMKLRPKGDDVSDETEISKKKSIFKVGSFLF